MWKIFWKQSNILPILPQVTPECSSNTNMKECSSNTGMLKQRHTPWRKTIQMSISNPLFTTASSEAILQAKLDAKDFPKLEYTTHGDKLDKTISGTHELLKLQKLLQLGNEDFTPWKRSTFFKLNFSILKSNTWTQKHLTATCKNIITQTQIKTTKNLKE